jgi:cytochrome c oxidase subunit 2
MSGFHLLPDSASTFAGESNALFYVLLAFSFALGLFLSILIVYYAVIYRRGSSASRIGRRERSLPLELTWTGITTVVAFLLFAWGADLYAERVHVPPDAVHVIGVGKQWMWEFEHPGGQREINELHVPVGRPVVVELGSQDVIHSFFVPAFRVKQDAVPGMSTAVWFEATKPGTYDLFCAEFCGSAHSRMRGSLIAMQPEEFSAWLERQPEGESIVAKGAELFRALGCSGCHMNGNVRAPDLTGVFGRPVALANSQTVIADTRYIRDSILQPDKEIAAGYDPIMPSFAGMVNEAELMQLVAYIRSLSDKGGTS